MICIYIFIRDYYAVECANTKPCKEMYKDDPRIWNVLFELFVADFKDLETNGLDLGGDGRMFPIVIGNKGDWSYLETWFQRVYTFFSFQSSMPVGNTLNYIYIIIWFFCLCEVTSGNLLRSYRRAPKGAKEDVEASGAGICHLCMAGKEFPWENLQLSWN